MNTSTILTALVAFVAFAVGYLIISWIFNRLRLTSSTSSTNSHAHTSPDNPDGHSQTTAPYEDPEVRYARVLGLPTAFSGPEIKQRYRTLMASYHRDKVAHLGPELRQMADQKTREIIEAYEYFRVKYNLTQ
jgi:hypothetical protein